EDRPAIEGIELRRLGPGDEARYRLAAEQVADGVPPPEQVTRLLTREDVVALAAFDGEEPVAFVVCFVLPDWEGAGPALLIYSVDTVEAYRRRGIAKALLAVAREAAVAQDCYEMWVLTDPDNEAGHALYRSAGGELEDGQSMFVFPLRRGEGGGAS